MHLPEEQEEATAGVSNIQNNYSRPDGQNAGNFLTDRPSSRVIHNPGGGSSLCLGGDKENSESKRISPLKQKDIAGNDIFGPADVPVVAVSNKQRENSGSGIFDTTPETVDVVQEQLSYSRAKSVAAAAGNDIFGHPMEGNDHRNVVGGVRKPPGGGSSIVF